MSAPGITVLKNNVPWGPFTRAQIDEGLERGDFTLESLAHAPGVKNWLPLEEVLHILQPVLPPVPINRDLPPVPVPEKVPPLPASKSIAPELPVAPAIPRIEAPLPVLPKASFFLRGIAFLIDCFILFVPIVVLFAIGALLMEIKGWWQSTDAESMHQEWLLLQKHFHQLLLMVAIGFGWLYGAGMESSRRQATIGKRWMGMKVTDLQGERISFLQATGRHLAKYLSALPFFLGFIAALFSSRGQALHDRLAKTRVVKR